MIGIIGCIKNEFIGFEKKELNSTASELLMTVAEKLELNNDESIPENIMLITYDLAAFDDMPTKEFQSWVLQECVNKNTKAVIVTKEEERWKSEEQAYDYLINCGYSREEIWDAEWIEYRFNLEENHEQISSKENVYFNVVFRSYHNDGYGMKIQCRYKDGNWIAEDLEETWRS